ncbi:MAG: glycosyltransferase, partial [Microcystaceae cyanobacterium]
AYFSPQAVPDGLAKRVRALNPDVINIHWTQAGFLQIESLAKFDRPLVLTLHDMWAITGGCHYTDGCDRYLSGCGQCPQLGSQKQADLSAQIWQRKAKAWQNLNLTIVTPSQWLGDCVKQSPLLQNYPVKVIPNGLDRDQYKPLDRAIARDLLAIPQDRFVLAFGAMGATTDRRKGFFLLKEAIAQLNQTEWRDKIQLLIFGNSPRANVPDFELPTRYLGQLGDDLSLRITYAAADAFLAPSLEDNLPNTVLEALACGTPCIAFRIGGMPDLITHQLNGYLAEPFKTEDFVRGIIHLIRRKPDKLESEQLQNAFTQKFDLLHQAQAYQQVFANLT